MSGPNCQVRIGAGETANVNRLLSFAHRQFLTAAQHNIVVFSVKSDNFLHEWY